MEFAGRTAVVTGGGSGIGRGMALTWASENMNVVVADIEGAAAEAVAEEIAARGGRALAVTCDVTQPQSVDELAARAYAEFDEVNILCNNAGVVFNRPLMECSLEDWHWVFAVNFYGVVHGVYSFVPKMRAQPGPAHIVNTSSGAGLGGGPAHRLSTSVDGGQDICIYAASKHAVVSFSEHLSHALVPDGIGVSVLCPSSVNTRIAEAERNRQAIYGPPASAAAPRDALSRMLVNGIDPMRVGEITRDGVRDGRFYLYTGGTTRQRVLERFACVIEDFAPRGMRTTD
jgi:NAD(P)-dependent dehydrogenase (short-subunit alcohol dehydrogenase family)